MGSILDLVGNKYSPQKWQPFEILEKSTSEIFLYSKQSNISGL